MIYRIPCSCGQIIEFEPPKNVAEQNLTPGLVRTLGKFAEAVYRKGENSIHLTRDMQHYSIKLSHPEMSNFQKLRYWGLVHKPNKERRGKHMAHDGIWLLTHLGSMFLNGTRTVAKTVHTSENHKVGESIERVAIKDFRKKVPEFQSSFNYYVIDGVPRPVKIEQPSFF